MPTLRDFLNNTLRERGPSTVEELATAARAAGATRARNPQDVVRAALGHTGEAIVLPDGRWSCAAWILDGAVLTHRLRAPTTGRRDLWPRNDLFPFLPLLGRSVPLAKGGLLGFADGHSPRSPVLVGPPGWLPAAPAGALIAMRWRAGVLQVEPAEVAVDEVADRVATLRDCFAYHRDASTLYRWQSPFAAAVLGSLLEAPGLLDVALPPLGEILADMLRPPELARRLPRACCCAPRDEPSYYDDADVVIPPDPLSDDPVVRPLFLQ